MRRFAILVAALFNVTIWTLPIYGEGMVVLDFRSADLNALNTLNQACGMEIQDTTDLEQTRMDFHIVSRVQHNCTIDAGEQFCPTFFHLDEPDSCKAIIYTTGNLLSTNFRTDETFRLSPLMSSITEVSSDPRYENATAPYRVIVSSGYAIISESATFVEIDFRGHEHTPGSLSGEIPNLFDD